jgi:hypothetical protein
MESVDRWTELARIYSEGWLWTQYVSSRGEVVDLPADFVEAFVEDALLDAQLVPMPDSPTVIELVRAGKVDARFPISLLNTLLARRRRSDDAEIS